jgi:hypothetical protein
MIRAGWVFTNGAAPVVTGQVPRASRYRSGYDLRHVIRLLLVMILGGV